MIFDRYIVVALDGRQQVIKQILKSIKDKIKSILLQLKIVA